MIVSHSVQGEVEIKVENTNNAKMIPEVPGMYQQQPKSACVLGAYHTSCMNIYDRTTSQSLCPCLSVFVLRVEVVDNLRQLGDFLAHLVVQVREHLADLHAPSPHRRRPSRRLRRPYRRRTCG